MDDEDESSASLENILCWFPHTAFEICGLHFERIILKAFFRESVYFFPSIFVLAPIVIIIYKSKVVLIWRLCVKPCLSSGCSITETTGCRKTFGKLSIDTLHVSL